MKTIGLIGGTSWESTREYYRYLNEITNKKLGGYHSAKIILYSVDFHIIRSSSWQEIASHLCQKAILLEKAGADCLLIGANTLHKIYDEIQAAINIPVIHIADAAGKAIQSRELQKVGLLGTRTTMEEDFYKQRLSSNFGIETLIPDEAERKLVQSIIYDELTHGILKQESRLKYLEIIDNLREQGAEGIILGCTEIPLLISQADLDLPVFDTTYLHSKVAVDFTLNEIT